MGEHERRERGITDDAAVRSSVAEAQHRLIVLDHFEAGAQVTIAVVEEGEKKEFSAFVLEHVVVEDFLCLLYTSDAADE